MASLNHPTDSRQGRASALIIVGVSLAIVGAVVPHASSPDHMISMVFDLGPFITGAAIGVAFASSFPHALTVTARQSGGATSQDNAKRCLDAPELHRSIASVQFGLDPEQVIGRQTGARTYPTVLNVH